LILILPRNTCASVIHDGGWALKILLVAALFIGFFFVDVQVFKVWGEISRYISILFLLFQTLYIIDSAYVLSKSLMITDEDQRAENAEEIVAYKSNYLCCYTVLCYFLTILFYVGAGVSFLGDAS
jgi:hypothetical protein